MAVSCPYHLQPFTHQQGLDKHHTILTVETGSWSSLAELDILAPLFMRSMMLSLTFRSVALWVFLGALGDGEGTMAAAIT